LSTATKKCLANMYSILDEMSRICETTEVGDDFASMFTACEFQLSELKSELDGTGRYGAGCSDLGESDSFIVNSEFDEMELNHRY